MPCSQKSDTIHRSRKDEKSALLTSKAALTHINHGHSRQWNRKLTASKIEYEHHLNNRKGVHMPKWRATSLILPVKKLYLRDVRAEVGHSFTKRKKSDKSLGNE